MANKGVHFILNFTGVNRGFSAEHAVNFNPRHHPATGWMGSWAPTTNQDDIKVNASVLDGPDLWKDPRMPYALFFSDPLMQALLAEGLYDTAAAMRCVVLPQLQDIVLDRRDIDAQRFEPGFQVIGHMRRSD